MARFKYLGEPKRPYVITQGPCLEIRIPKKDGTALVISPPNGQDIFLIGKDIGVDVKDARAIRCLEADERFQRIS